ncbi:methyltransferase [Sneathia sanguinegens]|jgi:hypothetical protein|uniref:tRNA1(Val) (adenine(37)-N6)-methyltransferase n=1 Tax=Sneathia sanguinegens TaxID=40543 RepID=UPI0023F94F37|nr:methyltransferase [Sneathia sanguinegens]
MIQEICIKGLKILQNVDLQSVTLDSLVLADFVKINRKVKNILEIGSGNGIISMLLYKKTSANIQGVEILKESYELAVENMRANNMEIEYINADIKEYSKGLHQNFDVIVSNPPYFIEKNENQKKKNILKQIARNEEDLKIEDIIEISNRLLKNMGHLYLVFRVERLDEVLEYISKTKLVAKVLKFVYTKNTDNALLVLIDCIKSGKKGLIVEKPLNIYDKKIKNEIYGI